MDSLQFDETEAQGLDCGICSTAIEESYYQVNQMTLCPPCSERHFGATQLGCSGLLKPLIFGFIGALLGAGLDFLVTVLTGSHFGLVALAMGWLVGLAVAAGSASQGGWKMQGIALLMTYLSISFSLSGQVLREFVKGDAGPRG